MSALVAGAAGHLVVRAGARRAALPMALALETMRAQPLRALERAEPWLLGVARIRGRATPVLSLSALLGEPSGTHARLVLARAGERAVAIACDEVLGARRLAALEELPPLARAIAPPWLAAIAAADGEALAVLDAARLLPEGAP